MKKPKKIKKEHYLYYDCEKYIANIMEIKSLRDVEGKYSEKEVTEGKEYRNFWHCICNVNDVHNGCYIQIMSESDWPEWAIPIVKRFEEEFGDQYWVDW